MKFCLNHFLQIQSCLECLYYISMFSRKNILICQKCHSLQNMISVIDLILFIYKEYSYITMRKSMHPSASGVRYHRSLWLSPDYIRRAIIFSSLTVRQHFQAVKTNPKIIMGRYSKDFKKKTMNSLKKAGVLDKFSRTISRKSPQPGHSSQQTQGPSDHQVMTVNTGRKSDNDHKVMGAITGPQEESVTIHKAPEGSIKTSINNMMNKVTIPINDVGNIGNFLSKLEDVVANVGIGRSKDSTSQTESIPLPRFRDTMDKIIAQKLESGDILDSLKTMTRTWTPINAPVAVSGGDNTMFRMVLNEERCLQVAVDLIRGVDLVKLAHLIRASVQSFYCLHSPGSSDTCLGCKYFVSQIGSLGLLKHEGTKTTSFTYNTDDIFISSTYSLPDLTPFTFPECPVYEEIPENDTDTEAEDAEEIRNMQIEEEAEVFPEALNLSLPKQEVVEGHTGQGHPRPPVITPVPTPLGHRLPQLAPVRQQGPVILELRHVALPLPQLGQVRPPGAEPVEQVRPAARARNITISVPARPVQRAVLPTRVTEAGAPANDRGAAWFVLTGIRDYPTLYNPSQHPSLTLGHGEDDRIRREVQEARRALRRMMGSGLWNTYHEEYGYMNCMVPYVAPLSDVCPFSLWLNRRSLPVLEHPSPVSVSFSNRGANLNADNVDVRNRHKIVFSMGYMLTPQMPKKWLQYNFAYCLYYGKALARVRFTEGWGMAPPYVRHFQMQQVHAAGMFLALDVFGDLRDQLIMAHAHLGVRGISDILNGNFRLVPPFYTESPPTWNLPLAPGCQDIINNVTG